jgi:hypothetical protein
MKISIDDLKMIIREEAGHLVEGCPVDLPCPYSAADELKASGASPEELLNWVATLTQELVGTGADSGSAEGVQGTPNAASDMGIGQLPMGIALESRRRRTVKKLSSRQVRNIIESVAGPETLIQKPRVPVLPKKASRPKRSSTLRKRR